MAMTLEQWVEIARRDDCLKLFVPSDIRLMLGEITRLRERLADCEQSLRIWAGEDSEYFMRYHEAEKV